MRLQGSSREVATSVASDVMVLLSLETWLIPVKLKIYISTCKQFERKNPKPLPVAEK
jgi:hypothetical protein